jgi:hypothetical protein
LFAPAVYQSVIRIPTPKEVGIVALHPQVERVMQEQIGQNRADDAPYTKGNLSCQSGLAVCSRRAGDPAGLECYGES